MTLTFLLTDIEGSTRLWEDHHEPWHEPSPPVIG
jgi:hypothetical protein